jgi:hypothetical protein
MIRFPFYTNTVTQKLDAVHALPDAARLSCFTGPSPDGKRFYGIDQSHLLPSGETELCIVEFEQRWDTLEERCILRFPTEYFPVHVLEQQEDSDTVAAVPEASAVEAVNFIVCGVMPLLGFVVVACCGDFTEDSGSLVLFRPYARQDTGRDCFPIKLQTSASAWSASISPKAPLLVCGSNAHTVNVFQFNFASSLRTRVDQIFLEHGESAICQFHHAQWARADSLSIGSLMAMSSLPVSAEEVGVCTRLLVQHAHNVPSVSFGTGCLGMDPGDIEVVASVSLDCTGHWTEIATTDGTAVPESRSDRLSLRASLGSGGMQRDGGWFIRPLPWHFWHANASAIAAPERVADCVDRQQQRTQPIQMAKELTIIDTCLDMLDETANIAPPNRDAFGRCFQERLRSRLQTSVWLVGTGYAVSVWRVHHQKAGSYAERIAALDLFPGVRAHHHVLFGVRYHAFCLELGMVVVALGMLLPRDGGLVFLMVDRWSGQLSKYGPVFPAEAPQDGCHPQLQRVYEQIRAPVCALLFFRTTLYILDRNRRLHTIHFTWSCKPLSQGPL